MRNPERERGQTERFFSNPPQREKNPRSLKELETKAPHPHPRKEKRGRETEKENQREIRRRPKNEFPFSRPK